MQNELHEKRAEAQYNLERKKADDEMFRESYTYRVKKDERRKDAQLELERETTLLKLQNEQKLLSLTQGEKDKKCCIQ